jgi:hypothetical protein
MLMPLDLPFYTALIGGLSIFLATVVLGIVVAK